jgi:hypothetical protein
VAVIHAVVADASIAAAGSFAVDSSSTWIESRDDTSTVDGHGAHVEPALAMTAGAAFLR